MRQVYFSMPTMPLKLELVNTAITLYSLHVNFFQLYSKRYIHRDN